MNIFFLIMALAKVYKTKKSARMRSTVKKNFIRKQDPEAGKEDSNKMDFELFKWDTSIK